MTFAAILLRIKRVRAPNCVFWAVAMWLEHGGYIMVRKSVTPWKVTLFGRVFFTGSIVHFVWASADHKRFASYVPKSRLPSLSLRELPRVLWFDGHVEWGDDSHQIGTSFLRSGRRRFLLLRVAAIALTVLLILSAGLAWWAWRIAVFAWEFAVFVLSHL